MSFSILLRSVAMRLSSLAPYAQWTLVRRSAAAGVAAGALLLGVGSAMAFEPDRAVPRVIGGQATTGDAHPYLVSIGLANAAGRPWVGRHFCGGTLISERHVLTAAHCVASYDTARAINPAYLAVGLPGGSGQLSSVRVETGIRMISIHPKYDPETVKFDAALIELDRPLEGVAPLRPAGPEELALEAAGVEAVTVGWGLTEEGGKIMNTLMEGRLSVIDPAQCASDQSHPFLGTYFGGLGAAVDTESMLCAMGYRDGVVVDTCQGDSGGPLIAGEGTQARLIGIVSWGRGCALRWPGVYTRVSAVHDWVVERMNAADLDAVLENVKMEALEARRSTSWSSMLSARVNAPVTLTFLRFGFPYPCEVTREQSVCEVPPLRGKRLRVTATAWVDGHSAVVITRTSVRILSKNERRNSSVNTW